MEAINNSHYFNLSTGQVTESVASPAQNEPVIGLEDRHGVLTRCVEVVTCLAESFLHQQ